MQHQLTLANTKDFIAGGKAFLTIRNNQTDERRTYRFTQFKELKNPNLIFVALMTGSDNTASYTHMGRIDIRTLQYTHKSTSRITSICNSVKGIQYLLFSLINNSKSDAIEYWHEGKCCRCGRLLTTPDSIESGIGPECAKKRNK